MTKPDFKPTVGEAACIQACPRCHRHTLIARVGYTVRADPENITHQAEIIARIQNRMTFDVYIYGLPRRMYLEPRDLLRIRAGRKHPVIAAHRCGTENQLTAEHYTGQLAEIVIPYRAVYPDDPPF